jgi:hypothetical protein
MGFDGHLDGLFTIAGLQHTVSRHLEQPPHHKAAVLEILDDQEQLVRSFHHALIPCILSAATDFPHY